MNHETTPLGEQPPDSGPGGGESLQDDMLTKARRQWRTTSDVSQEAEEALSRAQRRQHDYGSGAASGVFTGGMTLIVDLLPLARTIALSPAEKITIGRYDPVTGITPELDLSSFAGYQLGVSRRHALILHKDDRLYLQDLGSRNGTYLNRARLKPEEPEQLFPGDEIRLGKMALRISFGADDDS